MISDLSPDRAARILIIEDEPMLREAMTAYLNIDGFHCQSVGSLAGFKAFLTSGQTAQAMVFDLGLPDGDVLEILKPFIQSHPNVGTVIVSARGALSQRIEGLNRGVDFYFQKPVDMQELSLVLKKLTQRVNKTMSLVWTFDATAWRLHSPTGEYMPVTLREKILLEMALAKPGTPFSRDALAKAWGFDPLLFDFRRMEALVRRLRKKCLVQLQCDLPLSTMYGFGFVFNAEAAEG